MDDFALRKNDTLKILDNHIASIRGRLHRELRNVYNTGAGGDRHQQRILQNCKHNKRVEEECNDKLDILYKIVALLKDAQDSRSLWDALWVNFLYRFREECWDETLKLIDWRMVFSVLEGKKSLNPELRRFEAKMWQQVHGQFWKSKYEAT